MVWDKPPGGVLGSSCLEKERHCARIRDPPLSTELSETSLVLTQAGDRGPQKGWDPREAVRGLLTEGK